MPVGGDAIPYGIPKQHFHLFIKECEWRFNYRPIGRMQETLMRWWFK